MAAKTDWTDDDTVFAADLNTIGAEINAAAVGGNVIDVSGSATDTAALQNMITAMTTGGKVNGTAETLPGAYARITAPVTIDLGYSNTEDSGTWDTETHEKVRLRLDILPDAGLGAALTIKGGFGCELDINVLGGGKRGTVTDADTTNNSTTINSPAAIADGLKVGAVVEISGAGYSPEGTTEKLFASVRSVNIGAGTFVVSEKAYASLTNTTMTWMDVAVRLEDHVGLQLNIYGKAFDGCLLAADAYDSNTKHIRSLAGRNTVNGLGVGKTIFWKAMEAHGSMGTIWASSATADYFGYCADIHIDHFEGGVFTSTITPENYVIFDRCNQFNDVSLSFGDRATDAFVKFIGGDVGRFSQIRCTAYLSDTTATITNGSASLTNVIATNSLPPLVGSLISGPGIPLNTFVGTATGNFTTGGTVTMVNSVGAAVNATFTSSGNEVIIQPAPAGVKMVGVQSIEINALETDHCQRGLLIIGGGAGANGINIKRHRSLSRDFNALVIQPGTSGTAPRVDIGCDYHFTWESAVRVLSGMTGGRLRLRGYIDIPNQGDYSAYGINCASALFALDVADLTMSTRTSSFQGSINHADPALIHNVSRALLGNTTVHGALAASSPTVTSGGLTQNATNKPIQVSILVRHQPAAGAKSYCQLFLGRLNTSTFNFGSDYCQATGTGAMDEIRRYVFVVPAWWYYGITVGFASGTGTVTIDQKFSHPLN